MSGDFRTQLMTVGVYPDVVEFICNLVSLLELDERLSDPLAWLHQSQVELIWQHQSNTLRLYISEPGNYSFSCESPDGAIFHGRTREGRQLVQVLRNLIYWLRNEPWDQW